MAKKLAIVHFQQLERYPPVMNMIRYVSGWEDWDLTVFSTRPETQGRIFSQDGVRLYRMGSIATTKATVRYLGYIVFGIGCFFRLLQTRPIAILYYETVSVLPVFLYHLIFPSVPLLIHYHEYSSPQEIQKYSAYLKFLYRLEKYLFRNAVWISHTNEDRVRLFKADHPNFSFLQLAALPNYPPQKWVRQTTQIVSYKPDQEPLRFVYVGALSLETMYLREFAEWIHFLNGKATWTIYSSNASKSAKKYLEQLQSPWISFCGAVDYFELPEKLLHFHIGIVFYKGHIPNYVYNAPNKLFEYLTCGLDVWYTTEMKGCEPYMRGNFLPRVLEIDMRNLNSIKITDLIDWKGIDIRPSTYTLEKVYMTLKNKLESIVKSSSI